MTDYVEVGPVRARRGSKGFGYIPVSTASDGSQIAIGVHVIAGSDPGPRVVVMATQHGDEIAQIEALRQVLETIDPADLRGEVVLVPVANPVAFGMGTRSTWMDALHGDTGNMNQSWPGKENGWMTQMLCHALATHVLAAASVAIDVHGGLFPALAVSFGLLGRGGPGDLEYDLSRIWGIEILVDKGSKAEGSGQGHANSFSAFARGAGITPLAIEAGEFAGLEDRSSGERSARRAWPEPVVTGITNVLKHMEMIDGEPVLPERQIRVGTNAIQRPKHGGLLTSEVTADDLGCTLPGGTLLGTLWNPQSFDTLQEFRAPFDQTLLLGTVHLKPHTKMLPGDFAYVLADADSAEVLDRSRGG